MIFMSFQVVVQICQGLARRVRQVLVLNQDGQFRQHLLLVAVAQAVTPIGKLLPASTGASIQPRTGAFVEVLRGMVKV